MIIISINAQSPSKYERVDPVLFGLKFIICFIISFSIDLYYLLYSKIKSTIHLSTINDMKYFKATKFKKRFVLVSERTENIKVGDIIKLESN
jgi:hypothetical protein